MTTRNDSAVAEPGWRVMRDGTLLFVRRYESAADAVLLAVHDGSSDGTSFHSLAHALSAGGAASVYVPDLRGHGLSGGTRGDGRDDARHVEDDIADLVAVIRRERPGARVLLVGNELAVRFAHGSHRREVDGYVVASPAAGDLSRIEGSLLVLPDVNSVAASRRIAAWLALVVVGMARTAVVEASPP